MDTAQIVNSGRQDEEHIAAMPGKWLLLLENPKMVFFTWRTIPVSKWLITIVSKSPKDRVVPLPNGLFMAYKWG